MKDSDKGKFYPANPHKYLGDANNIIYRSSWELEFFKWLDKTKTIIGWNSEELVIPYINVLNRTPHRYFPDVFARVVIKGKIVPVLIEIKPEQFSVLPERKKNQKKQTYNESMERYYQNASKWLAARQYCKERGWAFWLLCKDTKTNSFEIKNHLMEKAAFEALQILKG